MTASAPEPIPTTDHAAERPGGMRGWIAIVITLGIMLAVPVVTVLSLRTAERDLDEPPPLDWSQRADWRAVHVQGTALTRGPVSSARTGKTYFDLPSPITPAQEQAVWQAAQLATLPAADRRSAQTITTLQQLTDAHPELFYPRYLLALALEDPAMLADAVALAPACLVIPVSDRQGRPAVNRVIGDIDLIVAKVIDDAVDETLVLRYAGVTTDEHGKAYLPVFAGKVRIGRAAPAPGIQPTRIIEGWIAFPGRAGRLPAWVVDEPAE